MQTRDCLLRKYKEVLKENYNGIDYHIAVITNNNAKKDGILLVGLNPAGTPYGEPRKGEDIRESIEYKECGGQFWDPKHEMLGLDKYDQKCGYIDLFPIRNGNQDEVKEYLDARNNQMNKTMGQLLRITQQYIEYLHPRLIIFANSLNGLWGLRKKKEKGLNNYTNVWMGYEFEEIQSEEKPLKGDKACWHYYRITGIFPSGVNDNAKETKLNGTYFLRYRQHKTKYGSVPANKKITPLDIQTIVEWIDPEWAKTLLLR